MTHYLALHYWSQFQKNLTAFGELWSKKHPEAAKNLKFEIHLKTRGKTQGRRKHFSIGGATLWI